MSDNMTDCSATTNNSESSLSGRWNRGSNTKGSEKPASESNDAKQQQQDVYTKGRVYIDLSPEPDTYDSSRSNVPASVMVMRRSQHVAAIKSSAHSKLCDPNRRNVSSSALQTRRHNKPTAQPHTVDARSVVKSTSAAKNPRNPGLRGTKRPRTPLPLPSSVSSFESYSQETQTTTTDSLKQAATTSSESPFITPQRKSLSSSTNAFVTPMNDKNTRNTRLQRFAVLSILFDLRFEYSENRTQDGLAFGPMTCVLLNVAEEIEDVAAVMFPTDIGHQAQLFLVVEYLRTFGSTLRYQEGHCWIELLYLVDEYSTGFREKMDKATLELHILEFQIRHRNILVQCNTHLNNLMQQWRSTDSYLAHAKGLVRNELVTRVDNTMKQMQELVALRLDTLTRNVSSDHINATVQNLFRN